MGKQKGKSKKMPPYSKKQRKGNRLLPPNKVKINLMEVYNTSCEGFENN